MIEIPRAALVADQVLNVFPEQIVKSLENMIFVCQLEKEEGRRGYFHLPHFPHSLSLFRMDPEGTQPDDYFQHIGVICHHPLAQLLANL